MIVLNIHVAILKVGSSLVARLLKNPPALQQNQVLSLGREDPLEVGTVTHSRILAWEITGTEEPGGLHSMELQREAQLGDLSTKHPARLFLFLLFGQLCSLHLFLLFCFLG